MKAPKLAKRVRRQISLDESMHRYFYKLDRYHAEAVAKRLRCLNVYRLLPNGDRQLMCIHNILTSADGFVVEVS